MAAQKSLFPEADGTVSRRNRRAPDGDLDITPMIDVTFLLLIFFMVSSTMQSKPDLDVPVARFGRGVQTDGASVITIWASRGRGATPVIQLGDGAGQEAALDEIPRYVEEGIAANRLKVVIKAEGDVPEGFVQDVAKAVKTVNGAELFMGVRDQPAR
jgi:biopolymer transport protein TolR